MYLLPKTHEQFSQKDYWNEFFKKRGSKAFEWYGEYPELCQHLHKYIKTKDEVLVVGCGNSKLTCDLYDIGYKKISNIDVSQVVIRQMLKLNEHKRAFLKYIQMDALNMTFEDDGFTVVLDKGTLDALMPDDKPETVTQITQYFKEIERVLKTGGRYVCVSLLQEHILKMILSYFPSNNWMFRAVRCFEAEKDDSSLAVFMVICTKFKKLPRTILEVNLGSEDKMQRVDSPEEVVALISDVQRAAVVCLGLKRNSIVEESEVSFDLCKQGESKRRFTVYIVDQPPERKNSQYAAFIVPQGREAEWLFSTKEGRKNLLKMGHYNRLAIVTMHRDQHYESLDSVQNELSDCIKKLAPSGLTEKILFLSLAPDVGNRTLCFKGHSPISGDFVVEDVETSENVKLRRLFFLTSQLVIQSEAKLKTIKSKNGKTREIVDPLHLTCKHHLYMSAATALSCLNKESPSVAVVGLGGGGLCTFLRLLLPKAHITAVEIDEDLYKVAADWFGLKIDKNLKVCILDGLKFLENSAAESTKFDAILFDVDSKDATMGMSCPPKLFLEAAALKNVSECLRPTGFFVLNLVLRDESLRAKILEELKEKFATVISYKLEGELNAVITCSTKSIPEKTLKSRIKNACDQTNGFLKSKKLPSSEFISVDAYLESLKMYL